MSNEDLTDINKLPQFQHEDDSSLDELLDHGLEGEIDNNDEEVITLEDGLTQINDGLMDLSKDQSDSENTLQNLSVDFDFDENQDIQEVGEHTLNINSTSFINLDELKESGESELEEEKVNLDEEFQEESDDNSYFNFDEEAENNEESEFSSMESEQNLENDFHEERNEENIEDSANELDDLNEDLNELDEMSLSETLEVIDQKLEEAIENNDVEQSHTNEVDSVQEIEKPIEQEQFQEVAQTIENLNVVDLKSEANPPFSLKITNIEFQEDAKQIYSIIDDFEIIPNGSEGIFKESLDRGHLLISHINEYMAILLHHKLKNFKANIVIGPSHKIHQSEQIKTYQTGLKSKKSNANTLQEFISMNEGVNPDQIIVATLSSLPSKNIIKYLGVLTEHVLVEKEIIKNSQNLKRKNNHEPQLYLEKIYQSLEAKMRIKAIEKKANAIIDLTFDFDPISELDSDFIKITCTGNAVIVD